MRAQLSFIAPFVLTLSVAFLPRASAHDTVVVHPPCSGHCAHAAPPTYLLEQPSLAYAPRDRPSTFRYAMHGLIGGSLVGLASGYLFARDDDEDRARTLAFGAGVGALSGAALGLSLGLLDGPDEGGGYYVVRDAFYGVGFGAIVGAIGGGLAAVRGAPGERVLLGTAVGAISGFGVGLITGLVQAQVERHGRRRARARPISLHVAPVDDALRGWVSGVSGRF
jgi:hypothetical protein